MVRSGPNCNSPHTHHGSSSRSPHPRRNRQHTSHSGGRRCSQGIVGILRRRNHSSQAPRGQCCRCSCMGHRSLLALLGFHSNRLHICIKDGDRDVHKRNYCRLYPTIQALSEWLINQTDSLPKIYCERNLAPRSGIHRSHHSL